VTAPSLPPRLTAFANSWISNPAARLQFALLILEVLTAGKFDPWTATGVTEWVNEERRDAASIGITERDL
jgi:hypothetical protein